MKVIGGSLAISGVADNPPVVHPDPSARKLQVMDVSDPENPHRIPELQDIASYAVDRVRGLLFVSNAQGLWILHDDGLVDPTVKMWEDFTKAP